MTQYGAEQIIELEFLEAVRRRPGMYIGNNNIHGLHHVLLEVLDNSVDECMGGYATRILVTISKNGAVSIEDDGRGIPVDYKPESKLSALTQVMLKPHAGGKFGGDDSAYSSSGGLHGIGLKCTNAFSSYLETTVHRHGLTFYQRFENGGVPVTDVEITDSTGKKVGIVDAYTEFGLTKRGLITSLNVNGKRIKVEPDPKLQNGTTQQFRPNRSLFAREMEWPNPEHSVPWSTDRLDSRFRQIAHLYPGVRIEYTDRRLPNPRTITYYSENGLIEYIEYLNQGQQVLHKPILFQESTEIDTESGKATIDLEIALQYAGEETQIYSFVNAIPTPTGGTHVTAFKGGLTKAVKQFASQKKFIKRDSDFRGDDVLLGLTAIAKVTMTSTPQFLSQTKESLTSPEVHGPVFSTTYNKISDYLEKNASVGKIIVTQAIAAARGREAASQARKLVIKKSALDVGEYVLGKLADVQRRGGVPTVPLEHTALYMVEGDSAGGSCKQGRDSRYHAILPLRGKIPNVEKMKLNDILKNREIASIVAALGAGVGSDCNLDLMRYGRVVVLVDADVDGSHIATLLATLFWRTMRPIIETGKFFIARPPLYLIRNKKKSASSYIYSEEERRQYIRKWKSDNISLQRYKGLGEMNPEQLRETVFVLPESLPDKKRGKKKLKNQDVTLTADHFSQRDIRMTIDDVHRTRSLIERLMGSNVAPRKEWLMNTDWSAEEDLS
jgi:DNA gyrase subunit B